MKKTIRVEIEIDDKYVEEWNKDFLSYHTKLYRSEEKGKKALEENPLEKGIALQIKSFLENYQYGLLSCNAHVEESNNL